MKKKILYITPYIPFPNNKAANHFISKRIELLSKVFTIDLLSVTNGEYDRDITKYKICCYVNKFYCVFRDEVTIKKIFESAFVKKSLFIILSSEIIPKTLEVLNNDTYTYVIIEHSYLSSYIIGKYPELSKKTITVFHNVETLYYYDYFKKTSILNVKKYYFLIEYFGCKELERKLFKYDTKAFWFLSGKDMEYVKNKTKLKNILQTPTINFDLKKQNKAKKQYDLLYMGQLDNYRNIYGLKWFIKNVWVKLQKYNLSFVILGRGKTDLVKKIISKTKGITLLGEVKNLTDIFSKSKITVIPVFEAIGIQTKLYDSLAEGNIVICTKDAIAGTYFKDNKHLIVAKNAIDYKNKILDVLSDINKYTYLIKNLEILKSKYSDKNNLDSMLKSLYDGSKNSNCV